MTKGNKELYGFGPFTLDVGEHRLERDDGGDVGYLPEKAFQTLVVLVRNAGSLVTKEQLLNEVWPDTIVEENNLDKCIYTIRHSLSDSPSQHRYIETVRKHGYRFIAEVRRNGAVDLADETAGVSKEISAPEGPGILGASTNETLAAREVRFRNPFEICQQARFKYQQMTAPTTLEARELVEDALRLDPDFALAHALSAELTTLEVIVGLKWPDQGFAEARSSVARAMESGVDSPDVYASAAYVDLIADWEFSRAEEKLHRALAMNEHHGPANRMLTEVLMFQGRHDDAAVFVKRAQVDTELHTANILAISRFLARDYDKVIAVCENMLILAPGHIIPAWTKCWALEQMGRPNEAIAGYERILQLPYGEPALRWAGYAYAAAGDRTRALDTVARLEAASREHNVSPTHIAAIFAGLGEIDMAIPHLERGLGSRDPFMLWVPTDPRFDNLREHDEFNRITARVLEKANGHPVARSSRTSKEIRIKPSVHDAGHGLQNEPIISTETTASGAFVINAKWRPVATLPQEPAAIPKRTFAGRMLPTFALAVLALVAAVTIYFFVTGAKIFEPKSIAILPFKPIGNTNRDELYEIGIADSLIQRLGGQEDLVVRPVGATRKYADLQQDPVAAGKEQQVDYVLSANYQVSDGKVRVTAQLTNVATGKVEETIQCESGVADLFAMQDAIADQISKTLMKRFSSVPAAPPVRRGTTNEEAYRLYLQGMYFYSKRTLPASKTAVELLERAVQLDPQYALAWAGKAHAHRYAGNLGRDTDTHLEYKRSIEAINIALSLNKDLSEAHSALCENKYYYEFDFGGAEAECKRAIALDPNSSLAHEIYGRFLYHRGRFSEGIVEINAAIDLEPASLFNQRNLGIAYYYSGRYEEAETQLTRVIEMDPTFASAYMWLRNSLEMQQKHADAFEWFIKAQKVLGTEEAIIRRYETAYADFGYPGMMREHARFADTYNQYYIGGILNAQIGDKERAFEYLERSFQRREWGMNSLLIEPQLDPLRSDPRFIDLVKRVGLN